MASKKKFLLRIDEDLWADLQAWAADELRSVNGQIEYLLKRAARSRRGTAEADPTQEAPPGPPPEPPLSPP